MKIFKCVGVVCLLLAVSPVWASQQSVTLSQEQLQANDQMLLSGMQVTLDQSQGELDVSPGFQYFGMQSLQFAVPDGPDGSKIRNLDSNQFALTVGADSLQAVFHFAENGKQIQGPLGVTFDVVDLVVSLTLGVPAAGASGLIALQDSQVSGTLTNPQGPLANSFLGEAQKDFLQIAHNTLSQAAAEFFGKPETQSGVQNALLFWAGLSTGKTWHAVVPGSVKIAAGEIVYTVSD